MQGAGKKLYFRADATFASPEMYEYMEKEGILCAIRLKANSRPHEHIEHLLRRPVGRPPARPQVFCHDFLYRAGLPDNQGKESRVDGAKQGKLSEAW